MRFKRVDRVNRLIKEELAKIILKEVNFPKDVLVTISRVKTAANLIQAKVFLTVLPEEDAEDILNLLNSRIYGLQQFFNKRVKMRPTPRLIFLSDKNTKEAGRIEKILEELKNREK